MSRQTKKIIIAATALLLAAAALAALWLCSREKTTVGEKTITVEVVNPNAENITRTIETDEEYLGRALVDSGLVGENKSTYGLFITTVNGYTADEEKQEWWRITKGGEFLNTGADTTPIADGDTFELTLTTGW